MILAALIVIVVLTLQGVGAYWATRWWVARNPVIPVRACPLCRLYHGSVYDKEPTPCNESDLAIADWERRNGYA
jgi:hypothetical protein